MSLFRSEVIESQGPKLYGELIVPGHLTHFALSILLAVFFVFLFIVMCLGSYTRTEQSFGRLVPSKGIVKIYPPKMGIAKRLTVREGDAVLAGSTIAVISSDSFSGTGDGVRKAGVAALNQKLLVVSQKLKLEEDNYQTELALLVSEERSLSKALSALREGFTFQEQLVASFEGALSDSEALQKKGHISRIEFERRKQEWLTASQQREALRREITLSESRLEDISLKKQRLRISNKRRLAQLHEEEIGLEQQKLEVSEQQQFSLTAPVGGKVSAIYISEGAATPPQRAVAAILPTESELVAELFVSSKAIAFVNDGQRVRLSYEAFPNQQYGTFLATIVRVSHTALLPDENDTGLEIREPVYRVLASIDQAEVEAEGTTILLQPGMLFDASIELQKVSFLDLLLQPLKAIRATL